MRSFNSLIAIFLTIALSKVHAQSCYNAVETLNTYVPCDDQSWVLYFEDNFDGSSLDESKWIYPYQGVIAGYDFENWKNWYANTGTTPAKPISDNIKVENGMLKIIARKENPPISGTYLNWATNPPVTLNSSFDYSSGWIESKKEFGYGKYEIRCKIPKGRGLWPSFWLFDEQNGVRSEIDVFEFWNEGDCFGTYDPARLSKNPHFTLHSNRLNSNPQEENQCSYELHGCAGNWGSTGTDFSSDYHVFMVEWGFYRINWYIDGQFIYSMYRYNTMDMIGGQSQAVGCNTAEAGTSYFFNDSWPFSNRMQVRFNMAIQRGYSKPNGQGYNNAPDVTTPFPGSFEIDYFRYYKQAPCATDVLITSKPQLNLSSILYNNLMGHNVTVSGAVTINSNDQLEIVGSNTVTLNPGFEVVDDAPFIAHIDPGYCDISQLTINSGFAELQQEKFIKNEVNTPILDVEAVESVDFKLYPNPVNEYLNLEFPESLNGVNSIKISDAQGRVLSQENTKSNKIIKLDVSPFANGLYMIHIFNMESGITYLKRFEKKD